MFQGTAEEKARQAEQILASIVPGAFCTVQDWDGRIDCTIRLADGSIAGEMVLLSELTEARIIATAERLQMRLQGIDVPSVNAVRGPMRIRGYGEG
jgi:hypothetical protein